MGVIRREFEMSKSEFKEFLVRATFGHSGKSLSPEDAITFGGEEKERKDALEDLFSKVQIYFYKRETDGKRLIFVVEDLGDENCKVVMVEIDDNSDDVVTDDAN